MDGLKDPWISVKEAAALMGMSAAYFRAIYCQPDTPRVIIRNRIGPKGGRRILVLRASIMALIDFETKAPA